MIRSWPVAWNPNTQSPAVDEFFREFFTKPQAPNGASKWAPKVDVTETPEAYLLHAELPGLKSDEIEITLKERTLTLSGEKATRGGSETDKRHVVERTYGSFKRSFTFPEPVDVNGVEATSENGLLTILVKKVPEVQPTKITIKTDQQSD